MCGYGRDIVCAYQIPGQNWPALQDYQDDDEHGAGRHLLNMLLNADIFNRVVFLVRYYGGEHLGPSRFQAYTEAAQSAITHDPYNHISKETQTPWPKVAPKQQQPRNNTRQLSGPLKPPGKQSWTQKKSLNDQNPEWKEYYNQNWADRTDQFGAVSAEISDLTRTLSDPLISE